MGATIEYQKVMNEIVYINLPGPAEPVQGMSGGELLHGFLSDLYKGETQEGQMSQQIKNHVNHLCNKWNVHFRNGK